MQYDFRVNRKQGPRVRNLATVNFKTFQRVDLNETESSLERRECRRREPEEEEEEVEDGDYVESGQTSR
jgi:hypothetical protein